MSLSRSIYQARRVSFNFKVDFNIYLIVKIIVFSLTGMRISPKTKIKYTANFVFLYIVKIIFESSIELFIFISVRWLFYLAFECMYLIFRELYVSNSI